MLTFKRNFLPQQETRPRLEEADSRVILLLSLLLMLTINFGFTYVIQSYYQDTFYDLNQPGFWLIILNTAILYGLFVLNKQAVNWKWSDVGLGRPLGWWHPVASTFTLIAGIFLIVQYVQPAVFSFTSRPDITHLLVFKDNLPLLIFSLIFVWFHGAFLQELIFRSFLINTVEILLGGKTWSTGLAIIFSSLAFGMIHAWQGWGGIILTTLMGLLFGIVYVFNGRRIWSMMLVHGLIDTITLYSLYIMD